MLKIRDGGWIPLVIGVVVFALFSTWRRGMALLHEAAALSAGDTSDVAPLLRSLQDGSAARVRGTAVYLHTVPTGIPRTMMHNLKHNRVVHERVVFLTIETSGIPFVPPADRVSVTPLADGFWRMIARHGFAEEVDVPQALVLAGDEQNLPFRPAETTYFTGRADIHRPGCAKSSPSRWRASLFAAMHRNAVPASTRISSSRRIVCC